MADINWVHLILIIFLIGGERRTNWWRTHIQKIDDFLMAISFIPLYFDVVSICLSFRRGWRKLENVLYDGNLRRSDGVFKIPNMEFKIPNMEALHTFQAFVDRLWNWFHLLWPQMFGSSDERATSLLVKYNILFCKKVKCSSAINHIKRPFSKFFLCLYCLIENLAQENFLQPRFG